MSQRQLQFWRLFCWGGKSVKARNNNLNPDSGKFRSQRSVVFGLRKQQGKIMDSCYVKHQWAIVYFPGLREDPFAKVPVIDGSGNDVDTLAESHSLTQYERLITHHGTIGTGQEVDYKVFMLCHNNFFKDLTSLVEVCNAFIKYLYGWVDPAMHRETAYALATSVFPPATRRDLAIHAVLSPHETKIMTRSPRPLLDVPPIRFWPTTGEPEWEVER